MQTTCIQRSNIRKNRSQSQKKVEIPRAIFFIGNSRQCLYATLLKSDHLFSLTESADDNGEQWEGDATYYHPYWLKYSIWHILYFYTSTAPWASIHENQPAWDLTNIPFYCVMHLWPSSLHIWLWMRYTSTWRTSDVLTRIVPTLIFSLISQRLSNQLLHRIYYEHPPTAMNRVKHSRVDIQQTEQITFQLYHMAISEWFWSRLEYQANSRKWALLEWPLKHDPS